MNSVTFFVPGKVKGKATHRSRVIVPKEDAITVEPSGAVVPRKPYAVQYSDKATKAREKDVASFFLDHVGGGWEPLTQPIMLQVFAAFPIPKRLQKAADGGQGYPHTCRPDASNIQKLVEDGLNKIAWVDDAQIWSAYCEKTYSVRPGYTIIIEWEDEG